MIFTSGDAKVKKVCPGGKEQQLYLERKQQSGTYIYHVLLATDTFTLLGCEKRDIIMLKYIHPNEYAI